MQLKVKRTESVTNTAPHFFDETAASARDCQLISSSKPEEGQDVMRIPIVRTW